MTRGFEPRKPANGFKKKIAKLEARIAELEQALAQSEREAGRECRKACCRPSEQETSHAK